MGSSHAYYKLAGSMKPRGLNRGAKGRARIALVLLCAADPALPNPVGMTVAHGTATAAQNGSQLNITASQNAVINWQSFNIGSGETTTFHQPSSISVVWNRIYDANPSQIWGTLNANGFVVLMNQNGFYFGPNCSVNVGGFVAAAAAVTPPPAAGGGAVWSYQGPPPTAKIINFGQIKTQTGGSLFLIAEGIENHGLLSAPDGTLGLYAGKRVLISERPDGRGLSASVQLPAGAIDNSGRLVADAGTIALHAQVVNQNGLLQANSVRNRQGVIELVAGDTINLGPDSVIRANGDTAVVSAGGQVALKSGGSFTDDPASRIEVRGGALGGSGGAVEISAPGMDQVSGQLDGTAQPGWLGGRLTFDPLNIVLATSGSAKPSGTVNSGDAPGAGTLRLDVNQAFKGFSDILLQATHDISLDTGTVWDLNASTGINSPGSLLTLQAGNNIVFGNNSRIVSSSGWSVSLAAGVDFTSPSLAVRPGIGGIYLNGGPPNAQGMAPNFNGAIEVAEGNLTFQAGHEVLVGSGYVRTVNGGNISISAGDGDVNAGTNPQTYDFTSDGYSVSGLGLGGIGTAAGGNVQIAAGRDILSGGGSIGAFGPAAGNVDLSAGRDIKGSFMVRQGVGTLTAGRDVGDGATPASFGLVAGGWKVNAARNLYVNEVYNPNGSLNPNRASYGPRVTFQFDYAPDAFVDLVGGHSVQLLGDNLARTADNPGRPPIYAPILNIEAGAGGVLLGNDVVLYPSPQGSLSIQTTDGGPLGSLAGQFHQLIVSDSGSPDYTTFEAGHAGTPLHLGGSGGGVHLNIDGDLDNVFLRSPEAADVHVHGNALNFSFEGQNLSRNDVTRLQVDGDLTSRSNLTFVGLQSTPDLSVLTDPGITMNPGLGGRISYNPATHQLGIQGIMTAADLDFLLHPTVYVLDPITHQQVLDAQGNPTFAPATFTADTAALQQLYAATQDIPSSPLAQGGLQLGGPGAFQIVARNLDLATSAGIRSVGPLLNPALASISIQGANLNLSLAGNLSMASSQIASFNGGSINVTALGRMDIGAQDSLTSDKTPKGIYTGHGGNVSVHAAGDILVQGSRIASYDGGNVTVISDNGTVDAGAGAKGFFSVTTSQLDPATGQYENRNDRFFGSGIMALTRTDSNARVGDITIQAGGDIQANSGGVLQLAFNKAGQSGAQVTLDAGGSILAGASGVLGRDVSLKAQGSIEGVVVASQNIVIQAQQNVAVTALAGGTASVSAGQNISGSIVGGGSVNVAGSDISASVISTGGSATTSGNTAAAALGAFSGVTAAPAQKTVESADKTVASPAMAQAEEEDEKKKRLAAKAPALLRRVGRVTVILPSK